jgi:hypothetical protein
VVYAKTTAERTCSAYTVPFTTFRTLRTIWGICGVAGKVSWRRWTQNGAFERILLTLAKDMEERGKLKTGRVLSSTARTLRLKGESGFSSAEPGMFVCTGV